MTHLPNSKGKKPLTDREKLAATKASAQRAAPDGNGGDLDASSRMTDGTSTDTGPGLGTGLRRGGATGQDDPYTGAPIGQ